jgi:hypothetical protein
MEHSYTVIWRPEESDQFRVDHVRILLDEPAPVTQQLILAFAAQEYVGELTGEFPPAIDSPEVEAIFDHPYDLIAIFEGVQNDIHKE